MRTVIGIVLICVVNIVFGEESSASPGTCHTPIDLSPEAASCGEGLKQTVANFGGPFNAVFANSGFTAQTDVDNDLAAKMSVKIGNDDYVVLYFHFHVGEKSKPEGSQHTENGKYHAMELHIEMKKKEGNGYGSLAFFIDETEGEDNTALVPLTSVLHKLIKDGDKADVQNVNLGEIVAPAISDAFYQYNGSHSTEPCTGDVLWTVFQKPLHISKAQMEAFSALYNSRNFRAVKKPSRPLNYSAKSC